MSYELRVGPIPDGAMVLHRCDVKHCVRPAHLFLGDQCMNMADMVAKGRAYRPTVLKTHCPHGHEYTSKNTYQYENRRTCRTCAIERARVRSVH